MKYVLILLTAFSVFACNNNKPKTNDDTMLTGANLNGIDLSAEEWQSIESSWDSVINAKDRWRWPDSVKHLLLLPDSITHNDSIMSDPKFDITRYYTPEQKKLSREIMEVYVNHIDFEDGLLAVHISRDEFVGKGIPEVYYDELVQSIQDMNAFNKIYRHSPDSVAAEWVRTKDEFRQILSRNP